MRYNSPFEAAQIEVEAGAVAAILDLTGEILARHRFQWTDASAALPDDPVPVFV
jgi:hypothetical protein